MRTSNTNILRMITIALTPIKVHAFVQGSFVTKAIHLIQPNWTRAHSVSSGKYSLKMFDRTRLENFDKSTGNDPVEQILQELTAGPVNPSDLQNTAASLSPKSSSQTVPQTPRYFTSTRPSNSFPSIKRYSVLALQCIELSSVPSVQSENVKRFKSNTNQPNSIKANYSSLPLTPSHINSIGIHSSDSGQSQ